MVFCWGLYLLYCRQNIIHCSPLPRFVVTFVSLLISLTVALCVNSCTITQYPLVMWRKPVVSKSTNSDNLESTWFGRNKTVFVVVIIPCSWSKFVHNALNLEINCIDCCVFFKLCVVYIFVEMLQSVVFSLCNRLLPAKLQEGNVFTGVLLFCWGRGVPHVTIIHDVLGLTVQVRLSDLDSLTLPFPQTSDLYPYYWHLVANTGDLFKLVHLRTPEDATSDGQYWRPVQICSLEDPLPWKWRLDGGHWNTYGLTSRWYVSY